MHISKIKFLREGKGKIGLKGKSYSFRRINKNVYSAPFKNKLLSKTSPTHISLSYSSHDLFLDFNFVGPNKNSIIRKMKDPILEYFPESFEELEAMREAIIRNQSTLMTLDTSKHENSFHSGESNLLVTELLKQLPLLRIMNDMKSISMLFISSLMASLGGLKQISVFNVIFEVRYILKLPYKLWRLQEIISDQRSS
jgi:hypothetical protein